MGTVTITPANGYVPNFEAQTFTGKLTRYELGRMGYSSIFHSEYRSNDVGLLNAIRNSDRLTITDTIGGEFDTELMANSSTLSFEHTVSANAANRIFKVLSEPLVGCGWDDISEIELSRLSGEWVLSYTTSDKYDSSIILNDPDFVYVLADVMTEIEEALDAFIQPSRCDIYTLTFTPSRVSAVLGDSTAKAYIG